MTRSKPQSDTTTTQSMSRTTARRLRLRRTPGSSGGTVSRRSALTKARQTPNSSAAPPSVRSQKNGVLSHAAFAGTGAVSQW
ncbi:MAG: hypothetical protein A3E31_09275 [Candidatus Rokubacteria bacterium RIFCSPHIGHO2_12_FULL_73_22]|nr:MAG: hypothetical protein A3E31_09275 [Candidatus Rokubacteria bacterium RIFCSPHIGHO2_12_FULL_73_22]